MPLQDLRQCPVPPSFRGRNKLLVQVWYIVRATFFRASPHAAVFLRRGILRLFGAKIGKGVDIRPSAVITYPWNLKVGDYSYIGDEVVLYNLDAIEIGKHVSISYRSMLCTGSHDTGDSRFPLLLGPISIGDECWIAADAFIAPNVSIGHGAVIGARSSVFRDVPPQQIWHGSPARYARERTAGKEAAEQSLLNSAEPT
jgi:putative colanic acid biosynthesis acetyltransferase WcaF